MAVHTHTKVVPSEIPAKKPSLGDDAFKAYNGSFGVRSYKETSGRKWRFADCFKRKPMKAPSNEKGCWDRFVEKLKSKRGETLPVALPEVEISSSASAAPRRVERIPPASSDSDFAAYDSSGYAH